MINVFVEKNNVNGDIIEIIEKSDIIAIYICSSDTITCSKVCIERLCKGYADFLLYRKRNAHDFG